MSSGWTTTAARVRIVWTRNTAVLDGSDANFTIKSGVVNGAPIANAGADQAVRTGATVTLNGSASSDPNGNTLTLRVDAAQRGRQAAPPSSCGRRSRSPTSSRISRAPTPRAWSSATVSLSSAADTVLVSAGSNAAPVANAGPDALVNQGATVTLDGSGSSDPDGAALTWTWTLVQQPAASQATLANASGPAPTFVADVSGTYLVQLVVGDGTQNSQPDSVVITANARPLANAGPDQTAPVGATVQLTGAASTDADGHPLTYAWSFQSRPTGSTATLSDPVTGRPDLQDRSPRQLRRPARRQRSAGCERRDDGDHQHEQLRAGGARRRGPVGARPRRSSLLDGSASTDVDGDSLQFAWTLSKPAGSAATLSSSTALKPTFTVDKPGAYVATLVVRDDVRLERSRQREHQHRQFRTGRTRRVRMAACAVERNRHPRRQRLRRRRRATRSPTPGR